MLKVFREDSDHLILRFAKEWPLRFEVPDGSSLPPQGSVLKFEVLSPEVSIFI